MAHQLLHPCRSVRPAFGQATRPRRPLAVHALALDGTTMVAVATTLPLIAAGGVAAWKLVNYTQLEVVTASMLTNAVPKDEPGPRVIQLQGGTRELYYYPKNTVQVTVVGERVNKGLLEQAGLQAAVPTVALPQSPANLGFAADDSVDAVVSLGALAGMGEVQRAAFTTEALRVLKPGRPVIFIERIPGGIPLRFVGASGKLLDPSYLAGWKERDGAFEAVDWDVALEGQDPYAVGVAVKASGYKAPAVSRRAEKVAEKVQRDRADREARKEKARLPKKGFDKNPGSS